MQPDRVLFFLKMPSKTLRDERGVIFITVLLLMLIVTLLGVMAIDTATVDMQIAGNVKRETAAFGGAEAGLDLSIPVIEETLSSGALAPTDTITIDGEDVVITTDLGTEILTESTTTQRSSWDDDIVIPNLGGVEVRVDIDRLYSDINAGSSIEFASGYEGVGAGAAGAGMAVLYRISTQATR